MKTIGIVGGIGLESTIDDYRLLIAAGHTQIVMNSQSRRGSRRPFCSLGPE